MESLAKELNIQLPKPKLFIVARIRDLEKQVSEGKISYGRFVEILNEDAEKFYKSKNK